jgi:NADPH2:quinone reductase
MQAVWYERKGPAREVLCFGELPMPRPGPGEILVKLIASAVNPSDVKARNGTYETAMRYPRVVPHQDGAGIVEEVGEGVAASLLGQRVWVYMAQWNDPWGTAAQYTRVPASQAVPLPDHVSFVEGACLGVPALTAHRLVTALGGVKDKTVLVQGGAGAVGFYAIQLARYHGAGWIVATASGEDKAERARWAGADMVVDRRAAPHVLTQRYGDEAFDRIVEVDLGANIEQDARLLKTGGVIACYGSDSAPTPVLPFRALQLKDAVLYSALVYTMSEQARDEAVADISGLLKNDRLRHQVYARLPLEETMLAHALQESGKALGQIILEPWDSGSADLPAM